MEALAKSEGLNLEKFVCTQPLCNIVNRDIEVELLPLCEKYGIGVTCYSPLARGVLAAKYHSGEEPPPDSEQARGIKDSLRQNGAKKVFESPTSSRRSASSHGSTVTQFALGWVLANPSITSAIIGPRNLEQLKDNLGALDLTITREDEKLVNELVTPGEHTDREFNNPDYPVRGRPIVKEK